jgi:hypothetical protein
MAITLDISIIENRLKEHKTKEDKLAYLNRLLFDWKKKKIEFNSYDKTELKRLKELTKEDFNAYMSEFDKGKLVYFDNGKYEKSIADRIGIKNLDLLKKFLRLQFESDDIKSKIKLFEELIKRESTKEKPSKLDFTKDKLEKVVIELSNQYGNNKPSTFLDEILYKVKLIDDRDFEFNFFLNIFHLCQDKEELFWSESHKRDISEWLKKCPYPAHFITKDKTINLFDTLWDKTTLTSSQTKKEQVDFEIKPVFEPVEVQIFYEFIKDFFSTEQQTELKYILETGNNANQKLLFKDNGNRLSDAFKKLIEHDIIKGCQKKDLEKWIASNFLFLHNGIQKEYKLNVLNKYISAGVNTVPCKSPFIDVVKGKIQKIEQPRTKKYSKY